MLVPLPDCDRPVFWQQGAAYTTFYVPGCVVVAAPRQAETLVHQIRGGFEAGWAGALRQTAAYAVEQFERLRYAPYRPECLTLYLHNACNLRCVYCYTDSANQSAELIAPEAVAAAYAATPDLEPYMAKIDAYLGDSLIWPE